MASRLWAAAVDMLSTCCFYDLSPEIVKAVNFANDLFADIRSVILSVQGNARNGASGHNCPELCAVKHHRAECVDPKRNVWQL